MGELLVYVPALMFSETDMGLECEYTLSLTYIYFLNAVVMGRFNNQI